jgi:hypothetical protein
MRTPTQIARILGWPEAKVPDGACLHLRLTEARDCPTCGPTVADELARTQRPRLAVWKGGGRWWWSVPSGFGSQPTWPQALAVGLAALESASVGRG